MNKVPPFQWRIKGLFHVWQINGLRNQGLRLYAVRAFFCKFSGSIPSLSLDEEGQGSVHFFQGLPSRCVDFEFFSDTDIANLSGLTAAEVGFLVVKPFKKHPTNGGQTGNAPNFLTAQFLDNTFISRLLSSCTCKESHLLSALKGRRVSPLSV